MELVFDIEVSVSIGVHCLVVHFSLLNLKAFELSCFGSGSQCSQYCGRSHNGGFMNLNIMKSGRPCDGL